MMQAFHWDTAADGRFYIDFAEMVPRLSKLGITAVWLPPAHKGESEADVGYGSYDYWDLGEFDQKGTVRTKYGTREELEALIRKLHDFEIEVYADMVFNHKGFADELECFQAVMVDREDRSKTVKEPEEIEAWTGFTFPGRKGKYSDFIWHHYHFTGVDYDHRSKTRAIYRIMGDGKYWSTDTDSEKGNYDYLMNADIDHAHPEVVEELTRVADFMADDLRYDGFRYDAIKHISSRFIDDLSKHMIAKRPNFFFVGEYWKDDENTIQHYLDQTDYHIDLFDVPLHFNLMTASKDPHFDLRTIFDGSLVQDQPTLAVTFVDNHDSQPGQALESWVENWFKPMAYALILLREGGYPCIFRGDFDGIMSIGYEGMGSVLEKMLFLRNRAGYGEEDDYFVTEKKIGWVRRGEADHPHPMVVLMSTGDMDQERMFVGLEEAGKTYVDWMDKQDDVEIDSEGYGLFTVGPGSVSCWTDRSLFVSYREERKN